MTKEKNYRAFVIAMLPRLKVLDYKRVKLAEREAAERAFRKGRKPPLKGIGGASDETLAVEDADSGAGAAAPVRAAPTEEQVSQIRIAISSAASLEEVQRLERALKAGNYELIAKAAEAALAAQKAEEDGA